MLAPALTVMAHVDHMLLLLCTAVCLEFVAAFCSMLQPALTILAHMHHVFLLLCIAEHVLFGCRFFLLYAQVQCFIAECPTVQVPINRDAVDDSLTGHRQLVLTMPRRCPSNHAVATHTSLLLSLMTASCCANTIVMVTA